MSLVKILAVLLVTYANGQTVAQSVGNDIAFTVKATNNGNIDLSPGVGGVVKFQTEITNYGNAFDLANGVFTAPVDGMYLFSASMYNVFAGQKLDTDIVKNGIPEVNMYCSASIQYSACSATVVLRLATSDRIWISDKSGKLVDHDSSFMGVLLNS
ncbi:hibernation-associated plasma protein HP-27-like [Mizuhopecten yessoensis]|uniref:Hibernation-associated plasma protein HP-27 n=1 Tax=Mizuhopecten yessoensis TaxID=6573 RepID=A0A210PSI6_MIZYE|nr:hibernation-associated plasma protein HP-27-like [Mizuhopecten yessoensis]OWF39445.1 Hibernation-associated plasma protein HP-27 [Mizuhopecten yessoensis]